MSWYSRHEGHTSGRVLHFLYHYCGLSVSERAMIGAETVTYFGRLIAVYTWEIVDNEEIPVFDFLGSSEAAECYRRMQRQLQATAIRDLDSVRGPARTVAA